MSTEWPFTQLGRTFFDGTLPRIARALEKIAVAMEKDKGMDEIRAEIAEARALCLTNEQAATILGMAEGSWDTDEDFEALKKLASLAGERGQRWLRSVAEAAEEDRKLAEKQK